MTLASRRDIKWGKDAKQGRGNPNYSGGRYQDDKGYIRVLKPEHPHDIKGYVYEHRLVIERKIGRYLESWEQIHHINEIKTDNRLENLFLTNKQEHSALHREGQHRSLEQRSHMRQVARNRGLGRKKSQEKPGDNEAK